MLTWLEIRIEISRIITSKERRISQIIIRNTSSDVGWEKVIL